MPTARADVRAVYDDIKTTRNVPDVNNFWKYLANDPSDAEADVGEHQGSDGSRRARSAGERDDLSRGVRVTNGCGYCMASHSAAAAKAGMTPQQFAELMAVVGMANETNRLANGYRVPIDPGFRELRRAALLTGRTRVG